MKRDPIWKRADYRLATYAGELAWPDVDLLVQHPATVSAADQRFRSVGSIGAHIAEGYSRGSGGGPDPVLRVRARGGAGMYWKSRGVPGDAIASARIDVVDQVVRLLPTAIEGERKASSKPLR